MWMGIQGGREQESWQMDSQTDPSRQIDEQRTRQGPGEPMSQNQLFVISSDPTRMRLILKPL